MMVIISSDREAAIVYPTGKRVELWHGDGEVISLAAEFLSPIRQADYSVEGLVKMSRELPEDTFVLEVA